MWAIVPLKSPASAKSRLSTVLDRLERREFFFSTARHVIATLRTVPAIERVVVVTSNDTVDAFARHCGATVIREACDCGTASAFKTAIEFLRPAELPRVLMIAADLPLLDPPVVQRLLSAAVRSPGVIVAPDRHGRGTNALVCAPPTAIEPCFGPDSFRRHCEAARTVGVMLQVFRSSRLALDIDVAEDLEYWRGGIDDAIESAACFTGDA